MLLAAQDGAAGRVTKSAVEGISSADCFIVGRKGEVLNRN